MSDHSMGEYIQSSFAGGLDRLLEPDKIAEDGYSWLVNARSRFGTIDPVLDSVELTYAPAGVKQGIYSIQNIIVLVVDGVIYYKPYGIDAFIAASSTVTLNASVSVVYGCLVESSVFNYTRKLNSNNVITDPILITNVDALINGTPAGLVLQDGVTQPVLIEYNSTYGTISVRYTQAYAAWDNTHREYVPVGKQMIYVNNILFVVAPDGKKIYRSISGRPLDFMVNIDVTGNKLTTEAVGGAVSISFAVDFNTVTYLGEVNAQGFLIGTSRNVYIVEFDYTYKIFGEPTFTWPTKLSVGVVNQFSSVNILGDSVFIDTEGIKSFNAVQQLMVEGRNSMFSLNVSKLLNDKYQSLCAAVNFNNYSIFSVLTNSGYAFLVYDQLKEKWDSIDFINGIRAKQFMVLDDSLQEQLYCITDYGKVYKLYASSSAAGSMIITRAFVPSDPKQEHKCNALRASFVCTDSNGTVYATELVDELRGATLERALRSKNLGVSYSVTPPIIPANSSFVQNVVFPFSTGNTGKQLKYIIRWDSKHKLATIKLETNIVSQQTSQKEMV